MLEHIPHGVGRLLRNMRAGQDRLAIHTPGLAGAGRVALDVTSTAFASEGAIPPRHTADGPATSPPLAWSGVPREAKALALLVEDADSPTPHPLVHAMVCGLGPDEDALEEGALGKPKIATRLADRMGRNSYLRTEYLPPDPPPGHGPHRYAFQVFALDAPLRLPPAPGRGELIEAMQGHVIGAGCLIGTYERP